MAESKFFKNRIWMVLIVMIAAGISAGLLTVFNICTNERITRNAETRLKKSVLDVFKVPYGKEGIIASFNKMIKIKTANGKIFYAHYARGKLSGIAFEVKGPGFWGPISSLISLSPDLGTIQGVEILHQEETPGLGGRIVEDKFRDQFKGKSAVGEISVDAITGATMTSNAFKEIINKNVRDFRNEFKI